jgi:hypothetical protein
MALIQPSVFNPMEILDKLFGSGAKVKIMRMYLFNPSSTYDVEEVSDMIHLDAAAVRRELNVLEKINFVKKRSYVKEIKRKRGRKISIVKKRTQGFMLDQRFPYIPLLQNFLINTNMIKHKEILHKLHGCGRLKLVIIAGVFIHDEESRVDMLIVGDNLKRKQIDTVIAAIETELGKEIKYAAFETHDFTYRLSMRDMLIRDILDYPHEKIIDKIGVAASRA